MRNTAFEFYTDPDHLAEGFLNADCIWDPHENEDPAEQQQNNTNFRVPRAPT